MRLATKETETENLFETLANKSPVGLYIVQDGKFCYINSTFRSITGYREDELLGRDSLELVVPEDREQVREYALKMLKGELTSPYQFRVTHKHDSIRWIMESVVSIRYRGRRATLGDFVDVTEHKQAEEALQAEKNKLQSLIDAVEYNLSIQDTEFNIIYQNEPSRIASGDHVGEKCYRAYESREKICDGCPVEEVFKDGKSHTTERRMLTPSGEAIFIESTANPIRDAGGRIVSCLELVRNITERKRAEEARREAEKEKSALLEEAPVGIIHTDLKGKITYVNKRFESESGYSREEITGKRGLQLDWFPAGTTKYLAKRMAARLRGSPAKYWETQFKCKDGRWIWIELEGKILRRLGVPVGFQIIARNITERKQAEQALKDSEENYRELANSVTDVFFAMDEHLRYTYWNKASEILIGIGAEDAIGKSLLEIFPDTPGLRRAEKVYCDVLRTQQPQTFVNDFDIDGRHYTFEISAYPSRGGISVFARDITERQQAEEALQIERNKLQSVIDAMTDALTIQDRGYNIIFQNEPSRKSTGGDCTGEKCYRVYEGSDSICEGCPVEKAFRDGMSHTSERQRVISGEVTFWENTANPVRDARGEITACLEIGRNITERKKQEQALADEATRRRILVDQSRDGTVVLDQNGKVYEANQRFAEMLGYTPDEVRQLHVWDWEYLYPHERVLEMIRNVDEAGDHFETQHRRKDGSIYDVEISTNGAIFAGQKLVFCVCRDVTERKRVEEAIKQAAEEWKRTFDSITDAISIHDNEFRILRANKAFADLFKKSPNQIIGKYCYELHFEGKPISDCPHQQTLATGKPAAAEFYESHLGKYLRASTSPIFNEKGEVVGTVHIIRDITEQKQQNERLMMADRLVSIGELAAGTAHELNNPLTSVIGFSQLLMEKEIPEYIREDVKSIYDEAQRAANVTKNLLTFARKHAPVKQPSQINNIIEDVLKLRTYELKVNSIEVKRQLAPDLPEIMVDYFQMQQAFMNIIINAEYFMTEAHKGGTLTVTTKKQNSTVRISFADDGPGIPPENLRRIFDPFFTTKEAGKGTGLGLSICHGIVTEHGGQIYAKSQPGKGATIFVELPIKSS